MACVIEARPMLDFVTSSVQVMPPEVSRPVFSQARALYGIVAKKSAMAVGIGALFCATEAYVEQYRGQHDSVSGVVAGLVAGAAFGITKPMPQPIAWPLAFASTALLADIITETMPRAMKGFRCVHLHGSHLFGWVKGLHAAAAWLQEQVNMYPVNKCTVHRSGIGLEF